MSREHEDTKPKIQRSSKTMKQKNRKVKNKIKTLLQRKIIQPCLGKPHQHSGKETKPESLEHLMTFQEKM